MNTLRRRMVEDLPRRGLAPRTQQCDVAAVHQLAQHYRRAPDQLSEAEIRQYFLVLLHAKQVAEGTFRLHLYGIRFCFETPLKRPWPVFERVRPRHRQQLPVVLSLQEVRSLLAFVERPKARMCLRMLDSCGLRLTEGTQLHVSDIAPHRMLVQGRCGTGGQDRFVPLAPGSWSCGGSPGSVSGPAPGCSRPATGRCP